MYAGENIDEGIDACIYVKPGNKNRKLGMLGDFEFVVDYDSTISLDIAFKIS